MKLASLCGHQRVEECESDGQFRVDFLILTPRRVWRKLKQTKGTKKFFSRSEKVFAWEEACICVGQLRTAAGSQGTASFSHWYLYNLYYMSQYVD